jgi:hypothetical protein
LRAVRSLPDVFLKRCSRNIKIADPFNTQEIVQCVSDEKTGTEHRSQSLD